MSVPVRGRRGRGCMVEREEEDKGVEKGVENAVEKGCDTAAGNVVVVLGSGGEPADADDDKPGRGV